MYGNLKELDFSKDVQQVEQIKVKPYSGKCYLNVCISEFQSQVMTSRTGSTQSQVPRLTCAACTTPVAQGTRSSRPLVAARPALTLNSLPHPILQTVILFSPANHDR